VPGDCHRGKTHITITLGELGHWVWACPPESPYPATFPYANPVPPRATPGVKTVKTSDVVGVPGGMVVVPAGKQYRMAPLLGVARPSSDSTRN
jgi:hypothetical protein